jgi:hypothetical protein
MIVRRCSNLVFDETVDGFSPAPNIRDILADRFGPEVSGKGAPTRNSRRRVREHG